jgi:hypothetical protein
MGTVRSAAPLVPVARTVDQDDLHLTLLHIGILPALASEIEIATHSKMSAPEAERKLTRWVLGLQPIGAFQATGSTVSLFGPAGGRVAALELRVEPWILHARAEMFDSLTTILRSLGVEDVSRFLSKSDAIGFTSEEWRPHLTLGPPALEDANYPMTVLEVSVELGPSAVRNRDSLV